jgi:hypothetical protein
LNLRTSAVTKHHWYKAERRNERRHRDRPIGSARLRARLSPGPSLAQSIVR